MIKISMPYNFGNSFLQGARFGASVTPTPQQLQQEALQNKLMQARLNAMPIQQQLQQQAMQSQVQKIANEAALAQAKINQYPIQNQLATRKLDLAESGQQMQNLMNQALIAKNLRDYGLAQKRLAMQQGEAASQAAYNQARAQQMPIQNQIAQQQLALARAKAAMAEKQQPISNQIAEQQLALAKARADIARQETLEGKLQAIRNYANTNNAPVSNLINPGNSLNAQQPQQGDYEASPLLSQQAVNNQEPGALNKAQLMQAAINHAVGIPYQTPQQKELQQLQIQEAKRNQLSPIINLERDANNQSLSASDRQSAAISYGTKVLDPVEKQIMSGTSGFINTYNNDVAPLMQNVIDQLNSQGLMAKGKEETAKIKSYLGGNSKLSNNLSALNTQLTMLSQLIRRVGGERASYQQIKANAQLLEKNLKSGRINEAIESFNKLTNLIYNQGNNIIDTKLNPVKLSYPQLQKPVLLHRSNYAKVTDSSGKIYNIPQSQLRTFLAEGFKKA